MARTKNMKPNAQRKIAMNMSFDIISYPKNDDEKATHMQKMLARALKNKFDPSLIENNSR